MGEGVDPIKIPVGVGVGDDNGDAHIYSQRSGVPLPGQQISQFI